MLSDDDHAYFYRRAEAELEQAQRATSTLAVRVHVELAERYMALCAGMTTPSDGEPDAQAFRR